MAKRIITKIGDVFCTEIDGVYKRFFQYITIDSTMLNSSTIRIFKKQYPINYEPKTEEIVNDEVDFYAHTVLRAGIVHEAWYKIGKSNDIGEYKDVIFRMSGDLERVDISYKWYIWHINEPMKYVGKLPTKYFQAEPGEVMPYNEIVARMKLGKYTYFSPTYR